MKYNAPYDQPSNPNAPYVDGNPSAGIQGSIVPAASIEFPQREIVSLIQNSGINPDNADLQQIARSIQSGGVVFGTDTGTASAYSVALSPPLISYYPGLAVWVIPANANAGPSTVNISGLGARNIVRRGGGPLQPGDMPAGYKSLLCYNSLHANFELYGTSFAASTGFMPILVANTNLYVNAATGDDNNYDGTIPSVNPPHGPFRTIMRAINETFKYGPSIYYMTINVAAGNYPESVQTPSIAGPGIILVGAGYNYTFVTGETNGNSTIGVNGPNYISVQNLFCSNTNQNTLGGGGMQCFGAGGGGRLVVNNCMTGSGTNYIFTAYPQGEISILNHDFAANSTCGDSAVVATVNSYISFSLIGFNATVTFHGPLTCGLNPSGSGAFVSSGSGSVIDAGGPSWLTWVNPGNVNGAKYSASMNGVIQAGGLGPNYYPGNQPGGVSLGGQYY